MRPNKAAPNAVFPIHRRVRTRGTGFGFKPLGLPTGTFETSGDVCGPVAIGGKADYAKQRSAMTVPTALQAEFFSV
jgi:hypothetical protein